MKKLSRFDLGVIIAFVVIGLLGGGAWYYLSDQLQKAQDEDKAAKSEFETYSTKANLVVTQTNIKNLQDNIDLMKAQLDPIIQAKLLSKENKLAAIEKQDPVAWKHDLDDEVRELSSAARLHGIRIPANFYFGFSRYISQNPGDEQTLVLSKQRLAIDQITHILINAPVREIMAVRRTYEEEPRGGGGGGGGGAGTESDRIPGSSLQAPGGSYTDYPFEFEFEASSENLRKIVDALVQSPYVFVLRTLTVQNRDSNSPKVSSLVEMAGTPAPAVDITNPGAAAAAASSAKGPQYLFGGNSSTLLVKARIDLIEWHENR